MIRAKQEIELFPVVAQPVRRRILRIVWDEERAAGDIAALFDITFGAVSQHLKVLRDAGAVEVRKDGRKRLYRARREALGPLARYLESVWRSRLDDLKELAEAEERETPPGGEPEGIPWLHPMHAHPSDPRGNP